MNTNLKYLDDTFLGDCDATVVATGRDEKGAYAVLGASVAYPQGGGQPADRGCLIDNATEIPLLFVGFRNGQVLHYVPDTALKGLIVGKAVKVHVDLDYRFNNARLHTGGHLVSHVIETIDPRLIPIKGYHFANGPYVEFVNDRGIDVSVLLGDANNAIRSAIESKVAVCASLADFSHVTKIRPHLAPFIPADKPTRFVAIGDYTPLPCGGTHITDLSQIGMIRVTKTKRAKENIRVSYEFDITP